MEKRYEVLYDEELVGVQVKVGDIVTVLDNIGWDGTRHMFTVSRYSNTTFGGFEESHVPPFLKEITDSSYSRTRIEKKIQQMWERQPYVNKNYSVEPEEVTGNSLYFQEVGRFVSGTVTGRSSPNFDVIGHVWTDEAIRELNVYSPNVPPPMTLEEQLQAEEYWAEIARDIAMGRR